MLRLLAACTRTITTTTTSTTSTGPAVVAAVLSATTRRALAPLISMEVASASRDGLKQRRTSTPTNSASATARAPRSDIKNRGQDIASDDASHQAAAVAEDDEEDHDCDIEEEADIEQTMQQQLPASATTAATAAAAAAAAETSRPPFPCLIARMDPDGIREIVAWRSQRQLPENDALHEHVVMLTNRRGARCYIVGTAHISQASVDIVEQTIEQVRPDTVMLELCHSRRSLALSSANEKPAVPTMSDLIDAIRGGQGGNVLYMLLAMVVSSMTQQLDTQLGAEQQAAAHAAIKRGCLMVLGDRPIDITLKRAWAALSLWEKLKLIAQVTFAVATGQRVSAEEVEQIKDSDMVSEMMAELAKSYPAALTTIVHERDRYLTACLQWCPGDVVVGVVGLGHVKGIQDHWNDETIDLKELEEVPETGASIRAVVLSIIGVTFVTVSALGYGTYTAVRWLLW